MPNDIPDWTGQQDVQHVSVAGPYLGDVGATPLAKDAGSQTISATNGPFTPSVGILASFKSAAGQVIARVGAVGALAQAATSPITPAFGQATTAGNLLVACVSDTGATEPTTAAAGWVKVKSYNNAGAGPWVAIWAKSNCGAGEAAPQFTGTVGAGNPMWAQLAEFSGAALAAPADQTAAANLSGTATVAPVAAAADVAFGDLVVLASRWATSGALATATFTETLNNSALPVHMGDSGAVAAARHVSFAYGIVPAAVAALPLGVRTWDYDVIGSAAAAANVSATVTLAAVPGKSYRVACLISALEVQTAGGGVDTATLSDSVAGNLMQTRSAVITTVGSTDRMALTNLGIKITSGASVTWALAALAGAPCSVFIGAYLQ